MHHRAPLTALATLALLLALALSALVPSPTLAYSEEPTPCIDQCSDEPASRLIDRIRCICECRNRTSAELEVCQWALEICTDVLEDHGVSESKAYNRCEDLVWPGD
jgi:hypothetical protein